MSKPITHQQAMKSDKKKGIGSVIAELTSILTKSGMYDPNNLLAAHKGSKVVPHARAAICYVLHHHYGFQKSTIGKAMGIDSMSTIRSMINKVRIKQTEKSLSQKMYAAICKEIKSDEIYSSSGPSDEQVYSASGLSRKVLTAVCDACSAAGMYVVPKWALTKSRTPELVTARHISAYILRKHYGIAHEVIGITLGGKDHATIVYANRSMLIRLQSESQINAIYRNSCSLLGIEPHFDEVAERKNPPVVVKKKDEGYIVPKNYTKEELLLIEKLKRDGAFRVV